jgi:hypothetical protein
MRPRPSGQTRTLAKALDAKVLSLVRQFVSEQASDSPTLQLRVSAIHAFVSGDPSLTRHKKQTLNAAIERALDVIRDEDEDDEELDSEFELGEEGGGAMMIPDEKQSNAVNRRITDMWGVNSGGNDAGNASVPQTPGQPVVEPVGMGGGVSVPAPALPASPKRKRKEKGDEGRAKRVKG